MDQNVRSKNNLVRQKRDAFRYSRVCDYSMVIAWVGFLGSQKSVREVTAKEVQVFLQNCSSQLRSGYVYDDDMIERLAGGERAKWIAVCDEHDNVRSVARLWDGKECKRILIKPNHFVLKVINHWAGKLQFFGIGSEGQLKLTYASHIFLDQNLLEKEKRLYIRALMAKALAECRERGTLLAFCNFRNSSFMKYLRGLLSIQVDMAIYEVHSVRDPIPDQVEKYGFEMSFV